MPSKQNPGVFDCYKAAMIDEPIFTILGRDPAGPATLRFWAEERGRIGKIVSEEDRARIGAAIEEATEMLNWRDQFLDADGEGTPLWKMDRATSEGNPIRIDISQLHDELGMLESLGELREAVATGNMVPALDMIDAILRAIQAREPILVTRLLTGECTAGDQPRFTACEVTNDDDPNDDEYAVVFENGSDPICSIHAGQVVGGNREGALAQAHRISRAMNDAYGRPESEDDGLGDDPATVHRSLDEIGRKMGAASDLAHLPEFPAHRFAAFHKGERYAYARGLEVNPTHLPRVLDQMSKDGWEVAGVFGATDSANIGFLFRRFPEVLNQVETGAIAIREPAPLQPATGFLAEIEVHITANTPEFGQELARTIFHPLSAVDWKGKTRIVGLVDGVPEAAFVLECNKGCTDLSDRGRGLEP